MVMWSVCSTAQASCLLHCPAAYALHPAARVLEEEAVHTLPHCISVWQEAHMRCAQCSHVAFTMFMLGACTDA